MDHISWERFKQLLRREYIFHIHTHHTDGSSSVREYMEFASMKGIETVIFTEHVRKNLDYDFDALVFDIEKAHREFPGVEPVLGVEAKILPGGGLDISPYVIEKASVICIACHSFPSDIELFLSVMEDIFSNRYKDKIRVWVHPGMFFRKHRHLINREDFKERVTRLVETVNRHSVYGENNLKYNLPGAIFPVSLFKSCITGTDAHSIEDLQIIT